MVRWFSAARFSAYPIVRGRRRNSLSIPSHLRGLLAATALVATGLGFSALARLWLGHNWSAQVTVKQDHELIRSGPYALVRHPIYAGALLALLGTAISVDKWRALLGF